MKILVIKNDGIGDLILSSGLISYLGENIASKLDLVTCIQNQTIAKKISNINKTFFISRDSIKHYSILNFNRIQIPFRISNDKAKVVRFSKSETSIIKDINKENYDLVIVLRRYIRQSSLHLLNKIKAKEKLCMWERPTNLNYTFAKRLSYDSVHLTSYNLNKYIRPELEYYEAILSLYLKKTIKANPKLNINTQKKYISKSIGLIIAGASISINKEHWLKVINFFIKENYSVSLYGAKEDIDIAKHIQTHFPTIKSFAGELSFNEYPSKFSNHEMIIGNDTGLTHFASLLNDNIIVFLGGGTFKSFFPWRKDGPQKIIFYELECYDCTWECINEEKYDCINKIFLLENNLESQLKKILNSSSNIEFNLNTKIKYQNQ